MSFKNNKVQLFSFIKNKPFLQIKQELQEKNINVKETEKLYLLYSLEANVTKDIELHNQCNGIILEKETNIVICGCQNKFVSINNVQENLEKYKENDIQVEYCEDGTMLRLYYYEDKWFVATSRCFDAKESFWISNKNYHDLFFEIFSADLDTFSKNKTYLFVLLHIDNRLVISHKNNKLIYLSNIDNKDNYEVFNAYSSWTDEDNEDINNFSKVTKCTPSMLSIIDNTKRGFIFRISVDNTYITLLYNFDNFQKNKEIRGNNNRIHFRYLEVLTKKNELLQDFDNNYPEYKFLFASIHHSLNGLITRIHKLYIKSHVKHHIRINENHLYYKTLLHLHSIYKKQSQIITRDIVKDTLYHLNVPVIARLMKWKL